MAKLICIKEKGGMEVWLNPKRIQSIRVSRDKEGKIESLRIQMNTDGHEMYYQDEIAKTVYDLLCSDLHLGGAAS